MNEMLIKQSSYMIAHPSTLYIIIIEWFYVKLILMFFEAMR